MSFWSFILNMNAVGPLFLSCVLLALIFGGFIRAEAREGRQRKQNHKTAA